VPLTVPPPKFVDRFTSTRQRDARGLKSNSIAETFSEMDANVTITPVKNFHIFILISYIGFISKSNV